MNKRPEDGLKCATRLRCALQIAEPLLRSISSDDAARRPAPGKWSPKEIIGHLIDSASNNHQRFVRGALQDDLVFPGYAQDSWVALQRYQQGEWDELIGFWLSYNRHIATVMAAVPAQGSLELLMNDYVDHLAMHLRQVLGEARPRRDIPSAG